MTQVLRRMRPPCLPVTGDMTSAVAGLVCAGLLLMTTVHAGHPRGVSSHRQRRSLMNLSSMVSEITGRKGSDFIAYGNWCGLGGSGRPIDPVDQCCQVHDICYNLASKGSCRAAGEKGVYQIEYKWKKGKDGNPSCDEESDHCKSSICMCDAVLTECLEKNLESYDSQNLHKLSLYELLQEANWLSNR